jgi:hypothetical protein
MAAVTFSALKTRIQREVNRPSTTYLTDIGEAIVTAIRFYDRRPVWFTEKSSTLTLSSGSATASLPTDFRRLINLQLQVDSRYRDVNNGFKPVEYEVLRRNWLDPTLSQTPVEYALFADTLYFNCLADQDYTVRIDYNYGDVTYPSADGDTSVWFDEAQDVIRYEATAIFYDDRLHDEAGFTKNKAKADLHWNNLLMRSNSQKSRYTLDA